MNNYHTAEKGKIGAMVLLGLVLGYALALLSYRQDTRLDLVTGEVQSVAVLFPFSIRKSHHDRAFEMLFPRATDRAPEWVLVGRQRFLTLMDLEQITEGYTVLRAENRLAQILSITNISLSERRDIATSFMDRLHKGGSADAASYATSLLEEHMLRAYSNKARWTRPD